jgi:hypothetical protein
MMPEKRILAVAGGVLAGSDIDAADNNNDDAPAPWQ